jgi:hypothetical protein
LANKTIAKSLDTVLEGIVGLGAPVGAMGAWHGGVALECDVQDILFVVTAVRSDRVTEASSPNRDGSFADDIGTRPVIITVGVTPNTVDLDWDR